MRRRRLTLGLGLVAVLLMPVGCGSEEDGGDAEVGLPPNDKDAIEEVFAAELTRLGLRLTRGALIDTSDGGYERSDTGTHLAVYVEPTGTYTPVDYTNGIVTTAQAFLPAVFDRWPGLESFDVCQEPLPGTDDRPEPPPHTQLYLTPGESEAVDWTTVTLAELLALAQPERDSYRLYVSPALSADSAAAELLNGPGPVPTPSG